ncbi:MAG TPA: 3-methyl-2-oxobutanoate hydroxymethyltransferase [Candidatus Polarisedimenticolia bacterium]|nr:3-methyl-2-oxobutanoate hydroxymethyltransferase [Candidatus Polarisedimenticolia bacterium]
MSSSDPGPITVPRLARMKERGEKIVMLTAYDAPMARLVDAAGIDIILVGDSVGNVVLGYANTLPVTLEEMIHHTKAVVRGVRRGLVVADMPYLSYHLEIRESVRNAGRLIQEAGAGAVKVEGGRRRVSTIRAMREAEIPVMGHVGLTPQSVHDMGGFKVQGRDSAAALAILEDALALEEAGVFSVVLEGIPAQLASLITERLSIPTLGIGAGPHCDGQVLVLHDLLGISPEPAPSFVRKYAEVGAAIRQACERFASDVRTAAFPSETESYRMKPEVLEEIRSTLEASGRRRWRS